MKDKIIKLSKMGLTVCQIMEVVELNWNETYYLVRKYGQFNPENRQIYPRNSQYFKKIDSKNKAYFLGLLFADGNIKQNLKQFRIKLIEPDKYILENFKKELQYNGKLIFYDKGKLGNYDLYALEIYDKELVQDLLKAGLTPNKSLTVKFPESKVLPEKFFFDFLRGYFDGDGGISLSKNHKQHICISFCVSLEFGKELKKELKTKLKIHSTFYTRKDNQIYKISISGMKQCLFLLNKIYENCEDSFFLNRKFKIYKKLKENHKILKEKMFNKKTSKYIGVSKSYTKYISFIRFKGQKIIFGRFKNEIDAAKAYNEGIKKLKINKPPNLL